METAEIIVIGAGIAGVSAAAELAADTRVVVLEMEQQPGYHATGRSASYFAASYGKPIIRDITASCESFFLAPPGGFSDVDLMRPRDCMFFARADQAESLRAMQEAYPGLEFLGPAAVRARVPVFSDGYLHGALREARGGDIDVDALLQGFLRLFRRRGGRLLNGHRAESFARVGSKWRVSAGGKTFEAPVLVNAAGGWAGRVAEMAGLDSLGIRPFRRTALTIAPPAGVEVWDWPEMVDVDEAFYFKPDAGQILISPADETPTPPCDAQPEELDVATGVYRFEQATGLDIRRVNHSWAGLRTFAPDRVFVVGFDPRAAGFFWLAGQGGYGVATSPALARLSRHLITGARCEGDFSILPDCAARLAPDRLLRL
jgi:D-arginine dehydrogenase